MPKMIRTTGEKLIEQQELMDEIRKLANINIVTCGSCGSVLLHRRDDEEVECPYCELKSDPCDFPDYYYTGMEFSEEFRELISEEIELHDDPIEDNTWEVTLLHDIFTATSKADGSIKKFRMMKTPSQLTDDERYSVLNYTLSKVTAEDQVTAKDIFLQAEFIQEVPIRSK